MLMWWVGGVGDCAIFNSVDSHSGCTWFTTNLVCIKFLLYTYHLMMSNFPAESTLLISYWAFLYLLMGSFSTFPTLFLVPLVLELALLRALLLLLLLLLVLSLAFAWDLTLTFKVIYSHALGLMLSCIYPDGT